MTFDICVGFRNLGCQEPSPQTGSLRRCLWCVDAPASCRPACSSLTLWKPLIHSTQVTEVTDVSPDTGHLHRNVTNIGTMYQNMPYDSPIHILMNDILGGGSTEAEMNHQALLEGNISTEACLIVLDTLSLFTQSFKVTHTIASLSGFSLLVIGQWD